MQRVIFLYLSILFLTGIQNYYSLSTSFLSILSIILIIFFGGNKYWLEDQLSNKSGLNKVFLSVIYSLLAVCLLHLLWNYLPVTAKFGILKVQGIQWDRFFLSALNIAAFCLIEELVFRGYFQEEIKKLSQQLPLTLCVFYQIMIPAILFSLMHCFKMGFACTIILIPGIFFGCLKYYSGNIYAAFCSHLIFNLYHEVLVAPKPF